MLKKRLSFLCQVPHKSRQFKSTIHFLLSHPSYRNSKFWLLTWYIYCWMYTMFSEWLTAPAPDRAWGDKSDGQAPYWRHVGEEEVMERLGSPLLFSDGLGSLSGRGGLSPRSPCLCLIQYKFRKSSAHPWAWSVWMDIKDIIMLISFMEMDIWIGHTGFPKKTPVSQWWQGR